MATKDTTFWSLTEAKALIPVTGSGHDALITSLADAVSARVEQILRRKIVIQDLVDVGNGEGRPSFRLPTYPVEDIETLEVRDGPGFDWEELEVDDDFEFDPKTGVIYLTNGNFADAAMSVRVTYSAGYDDQDGADLPADIVGHAAAWLRFAYQRASGALTATNAGGSSASSATVLPEPPKDILDALKARAKVRV